MSICSRTRGNPALHIGPTWATQNDPQSVNTTMTTHGGRRGCHGVAGQRCGDEGGGRPFESLLRGPAAAAAAAPPPPHPVGVTPLRARRGGVVRAAVAVGVQEQLPPEGGGAEALLHRLAGILAAVVLSWTTTFEYRLVSTHIRIYF